mmetsp:Transcript_25020/g.25472  ORF Transcript_25020/g.25472 Transcript_25020/m.25472 type:complete len:165 (-) Transcript_25020:547-1041(-)
MANLLSLKHLINLLRGKISTISIQNNKLSCENKNLVMQSDGLMEAEGNLNDILSQQNCTMNNFIGVIKEGKDLKKRMKRTMDLIMYQNLLGFVIDSDLNQNFKIDAMEIDLLIHRLDTFDYFNIDEKRLREMIGHNEGDIYATVADIVDIIENGEEEEVCFRYS